MGSGLAFCLGKRQDLTPSFPPLEEFLADRQKLKLRALKNAMEGRQTPVTTPADIERWLLAAAAVARPDAVSRQRLASIIAAVRAR